MIIDLIAKIPWLGKRLKVTKGGTLATDKDAWPEIKDQLFICDPQNPGGLVFWFDEQDGQKKFHLGQMRRP